MSYCWCRKNTLYRSKHHLSQEYKFLLLKKTHKYTHTFRKQRIDETKITASPVFYFYFKAFKATLYQTSPDKLEKSFENVFHPYFCQYPAQWFMLPLCNYLQKSHYILKPDGIWIPLLFLALPCICKHSEGNFKYSLKPNVAWQGWVTNSLPFCHTTFPPLE